MEQLRWWMRGVGAFYLLMALFNTPPVIEARLEKQYPNLGVPVESAAAQALVDTWFMFGLEVGVIGVALLVLSRNPLQHLAVVWIVVALEAVRGIADYIYLIARGADNVPVYAAWIVIHSIIIVTGVMAARRASSEAGGQQQDVAKREVSHDARA